MFFFKNQKVHMDAFTNRPEVYQFSKIDKAVSHLPTWWKNILQPKLSIQISDTNQQTTMKHCIGFINYFKKSYVIPMWSDLLLEIGREGTTEYRWKFADLTSSIGVHPASQRGSYLNEYKYQHFKLNTPWIIKTNKLIYFSWSGAVWNLEEPEKIICFPAIIELYNQCTASINIACKRSNQNTEMLIPFGQPLIHMIPMTEKEVVLKTHLVSDAELKRINGSTFFPLTFVNPYSKLKKSKNVAEL